MAGVGSDVRYNDDADVVGFVVDVAVAGRLVVVVVVVVVGCLAVDEAIRSASGQAVAFSWDRVILLRVVPVLLVVVQLLVYLGLPSSSCLSCSP